MKETKETYTMGLRCSNCSMMMDYKIPKGKQSVIFKQENSCDNCGCSLDFLKLMLERTKLLKGAVK